MINNYHMLAFVSTFVPLLNITHTNAHKESKQITKEN